MPPPHPVSPAPPAATTPPAAPKPPVAPNAAPAVQPPASRRCNLKSSMSRRLRHLPVHRLPAARVRGNTCAMDRRGTPPRMPHLLRRRMPHRPRHANAPPGGPAATPNAAPARPGPGGRPRCRPERPQAPHRSSVMPHHGHRAASGRAGARRGPDTDRAGCDSTGTAPHGRLPWRASRNPARRPHGIHRTRPRHRGRSRRPVVHSARRAGPLPFRRP